MLVVHEYFDYRTWRVEPRSPEIEEFVQGVMASWRADGGEPDIGLDLLGWLAELGFTTTSLRPESPPGPPWSSWTSHAASGRTNDVCNAGPRQPVASPCGRRLTWLGLPGPGQPLRLRF